MDEKNRTVYCPKCEQASKVGNNFDGKCPHCGEEVPTQIVWPH